MRSAGNFSPEWGYLAPAPSFARIARVILVATAIGATAGAGVVLSLLDRPSEPEKSPVAARAIVTSVRAAASDRRACSTFPATFPESPRPAVSLAVERLDNDLAQPSRIQNNLLLVPLVGNEVNVLLRN